MATSILSTEPYIHRPIQDCESIFWLITLDLLGKVGTKATKYRLANIINPRGSIGLGRCTKMALITDLHRFESDPQRLKSHVSLNTPKNSSMFFCVTALMRELVANNYNHNYEYAKEGTENDCFDRCIGIVKQTLDTPVQQVTEGIARTSLSP
jgi:hypothetical protein